MNLVERLAEKYESLERDNLIDDVPRFWLNAIADEMEKERNRLFAEADDTTEAYPMHAILSAKGNEINAGVTWLRAQAEEE